MKNTISPFKSFAQGVSRIFDFWGSTQNIKPMTPEEARQADYLALSSDWEAVGNDLRQSMVEKG